MVFDCAVIQILISSPNNMDNDREAVRRSIEEWNGQHGANERVVFIPLMWKKNTVPQHGVRPQAAINRQIVEKADAVIALLWTKLGSDTGVAVSGTIEELELAAKAKKPAALYFSKAPVNPHEIDSDALKRLSDFRKTYKGLYDEYDRPEDLAAEVSTLLFNWVKGFQTRSTTHGKRSEKVEEAKRAKYRRFYVRAAKDIYEVRNAAKIGVDVWEAMGKLVAVRQKIRNRNRERRLLKNLTVQDEPKLEPLATYPDLSVIESWYERFNPGVMLLIDRCPPKEKSSIRGYFSVWPLTEEAATAILSGTKAESEIGPLDIVSGDVRRHGWWYIADTLRQQDPSRFTRDEMVTTLISESLRVLGQHLSPHEIVHFVAIGGSPQGEALMREFGFSRVAAPGPNHLFQRYSTLDSFLRHA